MRIKMYFTSFIIFNIIITNAQLSNYSRHRLFMNLGIGLAPTVPDRWPTYNPKVNGFNNRIRIIDLPIEIGLNFAVSNITSLKAQYGIYRTFMTVKTINESNVNYSDQTHTRQPFLVQDYTFGIQLGGSKYISPINRVYFEFEYCYSTQTMNNTYYNTNLKANAGTFAFGVFSNFYLKQSKAFNWYGGLRFGIPLFSNFDFQPKQNYANTIHQEDTYTSISEAIMIGKSAQLKLGIRYMLPF